MSAPHSSGVEWAPDKDEHPGLISRLVHASGIALNAFKEAINPPEPLCKDESCPYHKGMIHRVCDHEEFGRETDVYEVCKILGTVIKHDITSCGITFLGLLLTYTDRNQVAISFRAESSTGKSYIVLQILKVFPVVDVEKIAGASATSLIHSTDAEAIFETYVDDKGKEQKRLKHYLLNKERKILVFKDQPDHKLMEKMRSFISKDEKESEFWITDRSSGGNLRRKTIIIRGPATIVYCSGQFKAEDQENTRVIILSPDTDESKLLGAIDLITESEADYNVFQDNIINDPNRKWLTQRITFIKEAHITEILLAPEDSQYLKEQFLKRAPNLMPRHTRDYPRLIALAKAHALLNYMRRITDQPNVIEANRRDIDVAIELYTKIAASNELGIPPALLSWYENILVPLWAPDSKEVADRKTIRARHMRIYHTPLTRFKLDEDYIPALEAANLVSIEQDPTDRRHILYTRITRDKNNAEHHGTHTLLDDLKEGVIRAEASTGDVCTTHFSINSKGVS